MRRTAIFGNIVLGEEPWRPGKYVDITVVFGSGKIDFRRAEMEAVTELSVFSMFGDIKIIIPEGLPVNLEGFSLAGDRKLKRYGKEPSPDATKALSIYATTVFSSLRVVDEG